MGFYILFITILSILGIYIYTVINSSYPIYRNMGIIIVLMTCVISCSFVLGSGYFNSFKDLIRALFMIAASLTVLSGAAYYFTEKFMRIARAKRNRSSNAVERPAPAKRPELQNTASAKLFKQSAPEGKREKREQFDTDIDRTAYGKPTYEAVSELTHVLRPSYSVEQIEEDEQIPVRTLLRASTQPEKGTPAFSVVKAEKPNGTSTVIVEESDEYLLLKDRSSSKEQIKEDERQTDIRLEEKNHNPSVRKATFAMANSDSSPRMSIQRQEDSAEEEMTPVAVKKASEHKTEAVIETGVRKEMDNTPSIDSRLAIAKDSVQDKPVRIVEPVDAPVAQNAIEPEKTKEESAPAYSIEKTKAQDIVSEQKEEALEDRARTWADKPVRKAEPADAPAAQNAVGSAKLKEESATAYSIEKTKAQSIVSEQEQEAAEDRTRAWADKPIRKAGPVDAPAAQNAVGSAKLKEESATAYSIEKTKAQSIVSEQKEEAAEDRTKATVANPLYKEEPAWLQAAQKSVLEEKPKEKPITPSKQEALIAKAEGLMKEARYLMALQLLSSTAFETESAAIQKHANLMHLECLIALKEFSKAQKKLFGILHEKYALDTDEKTRIKDIMMLLKSVGSGQGA